MAKNPCLPGRNNGRSRTVSTETGIENQGPVRHAAGLDDLRAEFEAARQCALSVRLRNAFIRTYRPVLDDATYRSLDCMADYRAWCERHLPSWLGYGRSL